MSTAETHKTTTVTYDLVMLLDPTAEEPVRRGLVEDAKKAIGAAGELLRHDRWGQRELAYPIGHATRAEYHLIQFHPAGAELLRDLQRTLSIADGIIRFRIVKLAPGTPEAPQSLPASSSGEEQHSEHPSPAPAHDQVERPIDAAETVQAGTEPQPAEAASQPAVTVPQPAEVEPAPEQSSEPQPAESAAEAPEPVLAAADEAPGSAADVDPQNAGS